MTRPSGPKINRHDVTMRLFRIPTDLAAAIRAWDGRPGPLRWSLVFPANRPGVSEPLVTSGQTGHGDFVFVRYVDQHRIAFGLDHWGGASISAPIEIDYAKPHEMVLSLGSLLPPAGSPLYRKSPELVRWRGQAVVVLDGVVAFHWEQEAWPATERQVMFGVNLIGGTATQQSFSGQILGLDAASPDSLRLAMDGPWSGRSWKTPGPAGRRPPLRRTLPDSVCGRWPGATSGWPACGFGYRRCRGAGPPARSSPGRTGGRPAGHSAGRR